MIVSQAHPPSVRALLSALLSCAVLCCPDEHRMMSLLMRSELPIMKQEQEEGGD